MFLGCIEGEGKEDSDLEIPFSVQLFQGGLAGGWEWVLVRVVVEGFGGGLEGEGEEDENGGYEWG
jgi:hypothetical protein